MYTEIDNTSTQLLPESATALERWQFRVLSGLHAGAVVDIAPQAWVMIGSAADCNLVLRDNGVLPHHLMLYWHQEQLVVRALHPGITVGDLPLEPGDLQVIDETVGCCIADTAVGIGCAGSPQWDTLLHTWTASATNAVPSESLMDDGPALQPEPDPDGATRAAAPAIGSGRSRTLRQMIGLTLAGGIAMALGIAFWLTVPHHASVRQTPSAVANTVAKLGLSEVKVVDGGNGHIRLEGTVPTETQRAELISALSANGLSPSLHVVSGQQLAMKVQDTFRQRGLVVEARYLGPGRIEVNGTAATATKAETDKVIADILKSTSSIQQIVVGSAPLPGPMPPAAAPVTPGPAKTAYASTARDPKRVIGVIDGEMAYVLTSDGTHYLVGSLMPDGSQVETIEGHAITFLREGQRVVVQF